MNKKVLLIEDDLDIQRIYTEKLINNGFDVILALDASNGLQSARSEKPSLILLDIMLPGKMNGFELLEMLKKDDSLKKIPIIVLTNLDTEKKQALDIGANDYLVKANTSLEYLLTKVRKLS
jgi:two-component system alkaline phosphatase synthesis response regulator PhoP